MIARWAAVVGRGSVLGLWLLVVVVATAATAVLSLDTTAVLVTPVVLVLARRLRLSQELFAFTAVWLANTASLILPVSNLTNLLAYARLRPAGVAFTPLMWAPALAVWVVTVVLLAVVFRRRLRGRYEVPRPFRVDDRGLLIIAGLVCAGLGPAFVLRGGRDGRRGGRCSGPGRRLPASGARGWSAGDCCRGRWCSA